tara:strand:+ start:2720 stop:3031 length:312 start_codon:yes stop_codon:yes gene_type:complete
MFFEIETQIQAEKENLISQMIAEKNEGKNIDSRNGSKKYKRKAMLDKLVYALRVDEHFYPDGSVDFTMIFEKQDGSNTYLRSIKYNKGNGEIDSNWNLLEDAI